MLSGACGNYFPREVTIFFSCPSPPAYYCWRSPSAIPASLGRGWPSCQERQELWAISLASTRAQPGPANEKPDRGQHLLSERPGSGRAPAGLRPGSDRAPTGLRPRSHGAPAGLGEPAEQENQLWSLRCSRLGQFWEHRKEVFFSISCRSFCDGDGSKLRAASLVKLYM